MRVVQLIDSTEIGGAEKMAVSYANALSEKISFSALVSTRKEGALSAQIDPKVTYLFLNKKGRLDLGALWRLRSFVIKHKVSHIHAHSTSFFLAFLLKCVYPSIVLIRHDHYGNNEFLDERPKLALKHTARFFAGVIVVNQRLRKWTEVQLKAKNVLYLPNFISMVPPKEAGTVLMGNDHKRILLVANLRPQKNHFYLLEVARKLKVSHPDWSFHLVGKDWKDAYSQQLKKQIKKDALEEQVFIYDSRQDIANILEQSAIGILTSQSEGLPLALLEYAMHGKAVVVTAVGELPSIVQHEKNGFVVDSKQPEVFYQYLLRLIEDKELGVIFGKELCQSIQSLYSEESVISAYMNWLSRLK